MLTKIKQVMKDIGYGDLVEGKTLDEILADIRENFVDVDDIDASEPFETAKYELKDIFYNRNWVSLERFLNDAQLEQLYNILVEWKQWKQNEEKNFKTS